MKVINKTKCPCCGSADIQTLGFDQFCFDCDWINATELVATGQFEEELSELEILLAQQNYESTELLTTNHTMLRIA